MNRLKVIIANYLLKHLFNTVTADEILRHNGKEFIIGGHKLSEAEARDIISGARAMKQMTVWQLISKEMKHEANKDIYEKSSTIDDIIFGKAILYSIDVIESKLNKLSGL